MIKLVCFIGCVVRTQDISFLMTHLHQYAYKWRDIGISLGFSHGDSENITHSSPRATTQQLLSELLSQWSQWPTAYHTDIPTMGRLYDTLRSTLVELGAVANDLYKMKNQLPSQVDEYVTFASYGLCSSLYCLDVSVFNHESRVPPHKCSKQGAVS